MLLTKQQRYLLEVLDRLGCVQKKQLTALVEAKFCPRNPQAAERLTEAMLRQLCYGNCALRVEGALVRLPGIRGDPLMLEAIDVMLELTAGAPLDFYAGQSPVLLRFAAQGKKINLFAVLTAEGLSDFSCHRRKPEPTERLIFLLEDAQEPPQRPQVPNKCFYATAQANGIHRFFEATPKI